MAALTGTPVVAVATGFMRHDIGGAGGNGAWLTGLDNVSVLLRALLEVRGRRTHRHRGRGHRIRRDRPATRPARTSTSRSIPGKPGENPAVDPFATLLGLCNDNLLSPLGK